ncbi:MAG: disulfide bond formation protein B [Beijerinckiaceae bacterium]|nr:disulfide bond formation protein B [Beijerinckiaceae bacterium]
MKPITGLFRRFGDLSPTAAAGIVSFVAAATISGAWIFEIAGYPPCDLCLQQRWAYYVGAPLAATAALACAFKPRLGGALLVCVALLFAGGAVFGAWHAGVEWGFWQGPSGCTGAVSQRAADMSDFLRQIESTRLVRCDEVALRIFGLSLAGWNAAISAGLAFLAAFGARKALAGAADHVR